MIIYLAGGLTTGNIHSDKIRNVLLDVKKSGLKVSILESFFGIRKRRAELHFDCVDNFMLDSGAFTFLSSIKNINWDDYITRYIAFIKEHNIQRYFELDIDKLVGYERVKQIRRRLLKEIGVPPIPVWHKRLGKKEFLKMCDEYDYVAIGGLVTKEILPQEYKYLPAFIREAHKRKAKIHGLGFTNSKNLNFCHFDSVDFSSWTVGSRFGHVSIFDGKNIVQKELPRRTKSLPLSIYNLEQWLKFSNYAEGNL